jgi:glutamate-ammonia-ligase adenylyltransferase
MSSSPRINQLIDSWSQQLDNHTPPSEHFLDQLKTTLSGSEYVLQLFETKPELLTQFHDDGSLETPPTHTELQSNLRDLTAENKSEEELHRALRLFRQQQMIRIIWRDLCRTADLDETLESLTALADICTQEALGWLHAHLAEKFGTPRDRDGNAQELIVIGMGKLGARELNLSSDIDLIFTFPSSGETDGRRALSNEEFFTRLCQKLVQALNKRTVDGFVFRVDTRLRPFGDSGPLVANMDFMEEYYQSQAREWERYAMIKARVIAGDMRNGEELMEMLRPFVYRRYLDYGAIESLRGMKKAISESLRKKGMRDNIKLGPGGIREIEFLGQAFQLIRGGRDSDLQIRPIQTVLRRLAEKQLIPQIASEELVAAYRFLRLTENRIQAWRDEQTHLLPADHDGLRRIAVTMGYADTEAWIRDLARHRTHVQLHFEKLFEESEDGKEETSSLQHLWQHEEDNAAEILQNVGYSDIERSCELLQRLRESRPLKTAGERGRQLLEWLVPQLIEEVAEHSETPEETLERIINLLETIAGRTAYLSLLSENPQARQQLVTLIDASPWFLDWIRRLPMLLDTLIDPRQLYDPLERQDLEKELAHELARVEGDLEQEMEVLRHFVAANRLRVAAADVTGVIPLMIVSDYLTDIATVTLDAILGIAWRDVSERHGAPAGTDKNNMGFAIIGYGKLGGIELGYGSDLDLVFIHNAPPGSMTDGKRSVAADVFFARLAQRMIHILTTRTPSGQLYEVDMRLRPNGKSGLLVTPVSAFRSYQEKDAWTWEHQALVRARGIAGDAQVITEFGKIRNSIIQRKRDNSELVGEVVKMREKMRESLDKSTDVLFDVKQGHGGITDIEFMVQYLLLRYSSDHPTLCHYSDNIRQLEALEEAQLLDEHLAERLAGIYRVLRAAHHRYSLQEKPAIIPADELIEERRIVREAWEQLMQISPSVNEKG